jgi:hypothetical protein
MSKASNINLRYLEKCKVQFFNFNLIFHFYFGKGKRHWMYMRGYINTESRQGMNNLVQDVVQWQAL